MSAKRGRKPATEPMVTIGAQVPRSVATVLRAEVARMRKNSPDMRGISASTIIRIAIREYVERHRPGAIAAVEAEDEAKPINVRQRKRPEAQPSA